MKSLLIFVVALVVDESACLEGLNVCVDTINRELCCSDYEDQFGICIACKIGFTALQGQSCKPCNNNRFGKRCIERCRCRIFQICDNVEGCVPEVGTAFNTTDDNDVPIDSSMETTTDVPIDSSMETTTGFSKENLLIYSLVATSMIFNVGTCFVCRRLYKKRARREDAADEANSTPIQITCSRNNSYISMEENFFISNTFTHESTGAVIVSDKQEADNDGESNLHTHSNILKQKANVGPEDRPL